MAFAAVYVVWGSTYLAIRFAIETIPPMLMAGGRFLIAGLVIVGWAMLRGAPRPTAAEWRSAFVTGFLMLLGGNGAVVWAEQRVPSGITALLVAVVPLWMVLLDWLRPGGRRPRAAVFAGLVLGLVGIVLLVGPSSMSGAAVDTLGAVVLVVGSLSWAAGSLVSRYGAHPRSPLMATGMQMLGGGAGLVLAGAAMGEFPAFAVGAVSTRSLVAFLYLVSFGSLVGFTAYVFLLRATTPARAATYAYVNPVVAVILGWALAGEPITPRTVAAAAVILAAVAIITTVGGSGEPAAEGLAEAHDERDAQARGESKPAA